MSVKNYTVLPRLGCVQPVEKVIKLDMAQHVANQHLELAQLWRYSVSWCTIWKGTPQECIDHMGLAHAVLASVKAANLGQWVSPWMVSRNIWSEALRLTVSGVSTDALLFSRYGIPLVHRYRVFSQYGTHISLRGTYMTILWDFLELADAESRTLRNRELARSLASRMSSEGPRGTRRREPA